VTHKDEPHDPELTELASEWPGWRFFRSKRSDDKLGAPYAARRRVLTYEEREKGLCNRLPHGFAEDDMQALKDQLAAQSQIEAGLQQSATP
jgi:hypothetical protein